MKEFHLHLVSDATARPFIALPAHVLSSSKVSSRLNNSLAFGSDERTDREDLGKNRRKSRCRSFHDRERGLRTALEIGCGRLHVPCISVLDPVIRALTAFLGLESSGQSGRQHTLDANYFDIVSMQ